jgi:hypothetical protein
VLDFREGQPEPASLADEGEQAEDVDGIATVAGRLTTRWRQNPARLVQSQRLATEAAACRDLADPQTVPLHEVRVKPAPRGKVKTRNQG